MESLKFVDKKEYIHILRNRLPHWNQMGCVQFVTFRLADSLPQSKIHEYRCLKDEWLRLHPKPWDADTESAYYNEVGAVVDKWLDAGRGSCLLKDKDARDIVENAIQNFDGVRYMVHSYVIMPNHVHVLLSPYPGNGVQDIAKSWKNFSAHEINRLYGRHGGLWQSGSFDHMVRSPEAYGQKLRYIARNPLHLPPGSYTLFVGKHPE